MIDKKYIQELADLLKENNLTELQVKDGEKEIKLSKNVQGTQVYTSNVPAVASEIVTESANPVAQAAETLPKGRPITSPMVGTFYKASSPDSKPFVEVGSVISEGQVICVIEAMKLMNEIESDTKGKITEICVDDGQPVEFGQVLMYVE